MHALSASVLLLAASASAHFNIGHPPQDVPSSEAKLASGPCGGASLKFESGDVTDFHVGGEPIAVAGSHPQSTYLFRATKDLTGEGEWTQIFPIMAQSGLGRMCQPSVTVPEGWAGEKGLISVVANAEDGILYGCSQVNFVEGTSSGDLPSDCKNTTDISFASDPKLQALVGDGSDSDSDSDDKPSGTSDGSSEPTDDAEDDESAGAALRTGLFGVGAAALVAMAL